MTTPDSALQETREAAPEEAFQSASFPLLVEAVDDHGFRVSGVRFEMPILIRPERLLRWALPESGALEASDFAKILESDGQVDRDILFFGNGPVGTERPLPALYKELRAMGVGLDVMETRAACRAYHLLASERRAVAAALIPLNCLKGHGA